MKNKRSGATRDKWGRLVGGAWLGRPPVADRPRFVTDSFEDAEKVMLEG